MDDRICIECPQTGMAKSERIDRLFGSIGRWINSDELKELVRMFGGSWKTEASLTERIAYLNEFAEIWDFRKRQADGGERWNIYDDGFVTAHAGDIMKLSGKLGLTDIMEHHAQPDYIVPLGGARSVNLIRPRYAHDIALKVPDPKPAVVALSGMRPISEIEKPFLCNYAPQAQTEYEAMCKGMETSFFIDGNKFTEESFTDTNANLSWSFRRYCDTDLYVLAAPSSDPGRRANSSDTFEFFIEKFRPENGSRILLITSCIYVPFQLLKFMQIALENDIYIECIGNPYTDRNILKAGNYLQEIKATINAVKYLTDVYIRTV